MYANWILRTESLHTWSDRCAQNFPTHTHPHIRRRSYLMTVNLFFFFFGTHAHEETQPNAEIRHGHCSLSVLSKDKMTSQWECSYIMY